MGVTKKGEGKKQKEVNLYWIYTATEFVEVDGEGDVYRFLENPVGKIPFVFCTSDEFNLIPSPDDDAFDNTLIVPKQLADLNYATQFQSHSIMYGIDVGTKSLGGSPDVVWSIKSDPSNPNAKPEIGTISPSVDTDKVIKSCEFQVAQWLESKGITPGSAGNTGSANAVSAVSKIVDDADTTFIVNGNRILLVKAEKDLWELIGILHNNLAGLGQLEVDKRVDEKLVVSVSFPIQQIVQDPQEKRNAIKFNLENKLTSYSRALKEANPDLSDDELEELKKEIEEDSEKALKRAQEMIQNQPKEDKDNTEV